MKKLSLLCTLSVIVGFIGVQIASGYGEGGNTPDFGGDQMVMAPLSDGLYLLDASPNSEVLDGNTNAADVFAWKYIWDGSSEKGEFSDVVVTQRPAILRIDSAISYSDDTIFFFGGIDTSTLKISNALWKFSPSTGKFEEVLYDRTDDDKVPSPRVSANSTVIGDYLYIIGGFKGLGGYGTDVWRMNIRSSNPVWEKVSESAPNDDIFDLDEYEIGSDPEFPGEPALLKSFKPILFQINNAIYMMGRKKVTGVNISPEYSLWKMEVGSGSWSEISSTAANFPPYREDFSYAVLNNILYMFGGMNHRGSAHFNDIYSFNGSRFSPDLSRGQEPVSRSNARMIPYQNHIYLFGGDATTYSTGIQSKYFSNEIWRMNPLDFSWAEESLPGGSIEDPTNPPDDTPPHEVYKYDTVIMGQTIRTRVRQTGKKVRCSIKKKQRIKIRGDATIYLEFRYGENYGMSIKPRPVISLTNDNTLSFQSVVDPGGNKNIIAGYWQVEGVRNGMNKPFEGFNNEWFQQFIQPIPSITYTNAHKGGSGPSPQIKFNLDGIKEAQAMDEDGKRSVAYNTPGKRTLEFHQTLPPGEYYIYVTAIATNYNEFNRQFQYSMMDPVKASACGRSRDIYPPQFGVPGPSSSNRMHYYYVSDVYRVQIPEVKNFSDILHVDTDEEEYIKDDEFLQDDFMKMYWAQPPNLTHSMRPIFNGDTAEPNTLIVPALGRVSYRNGKVQNVLTVLNDSPFIGSTRDTDEYLDVMKEVFAGRGFKYTMMTDSNGRFNYQTLNMLPYNEPERIPYYMFHFLTFVPNEKNDVGFDVYGAPPVKVSIVNNSLMPRIFNYDYGDTTVTPRPVFQGSYFPNREFLVKYSVHEPFTVKADFEGNFVFTFPYNLESGQNEIEFISANDETQVKEFVLRYDAGADDVLPQLININTGTPVFTNFPVILGTYKPDTQVVYKLNTNPGIAISTDEYGHFALNMPQLAGNLSGGSSGLQSIEVFPDGNPHKLTRKTIKVYEKYEIQEGSTFTIHRAQDLIALIDGGEISVNKDVRLFLHTGDKIKVLSDESVINVPIGTKIYNAQIGAVTSVNQGGFFQFYKDDQIILPRFGGQIWIEDNEQKDIVVPANTIVVAFNNEAIFTYNDKGDIYSIDRFQYTSSGGSSAEIERMNVKDYFYEPQFRTPVLYNYINGENLRSRKPFFEGAASPNSIVEVWMRKLGGEKDSEKEHLVGTTVTDFYGRFLIRVSETIDPGNEYEFIFSDRANQTPSMRVILAAPQNLPQHSGRVQYSLQYGDEPVHSLDHITQKRLPTFWQEQVW